ncbi:DUF5131 family protein [Nonomuraea typhae]|uniref:DUF5131 family protein n=1 Tax=Nonomuraea typhae TaxID=2603600 RepID=UPI0012FC1D98|nr:phage Gp37/Gp68 family protein [Nonomuraea typhae]
MSDKTKIEWSDATWNPVTGCTKISPGCDHCYAEGIARRFAGGKAFPNGFDVTLQPKRLDQPLRWREPRRIFVNSMSDLFHEDVPDEYIAQVWTVMAKTPQHTYQILTKRHARMRSVVRRIAWRLPTTEGRSQGVRGSVAYVQNSELLNEHLGAPEVLPNVWLGVSVENQQWAETRIPALLETPAAVRFISAEPLLGPVNLRRLQVRGRVIDCLGGDVVDPSDGAVLYGTPSVLDWVIVGGESGPGARPMHPDWARGLRNQCQGYAAFHFKQHGEWEPLGPLYGDVSDDEEADDARMEAVGLEVVEGKQVIQLERDGYIAEGHQPADSRTWLMAKVGKKRAGRELDGRTWDQFPDTKPQEVALHG